MATANPSESDAIGVGAHELLVTVFRALEARESNLTPVTGTLRVLLRGGVALDADCRTLATVLADACEVPNDPGDRPVKPGKGDRLVVTLDSREEAAEARDTYASALVELGLASTHGVLVAHVPQGWLVRFRRTPSARSDRPAVVMTNNKKEI